MGTRAASIVCLLGSCVGFLGCTLVVEGKIDKTPKHAIEDELDSGTDGAIGIESDAERTGDDDDAQAASDAAAGADAAGSSSDGATAHPEGGVGGNGMVKVSLGQNHACGIDAAGKIRCWGANSENQTTLPTDRRYKDVACGDYHSCAIDTNGALVCAGRNRDGQRASDNGPFTQVTAGDSHTCTLDAAGRAKCWGLDASGQSTPPADALSSISAGTAFTCGIRKADAAIACWGNGASTFVAQVKDKKFKSIDAAPTYICGATDDDEGMCWNESNYKPPALGKVKQIAAGDLCGCALLVDDTVRCWYLNWSDLIGAEKAPFDYVAVGGTGRCAIPKTGSIYCDPADNGAIAPGPSDFP